MRKMKKHLYITLTYYIVHLVDTYGMEMCLFIEIKESKLMVFEKKKTYSKFLN